MQEDCIQETELSGVFLIQRPTYTDDRGFFREIYRKLDLDSRLGFPFNPVQTNHARSKKGTLRGIHIAPWHKLATVLHGQVQQVVVDVRPGSLTFGKHISVVLGEDNWHAVFIPANCGNAVLALTDVVDYHYSFGDYWTPGSEKAVMYNDPSLAISWELDEVHLSDKDLKNPTFRETFPQKI